MLKNVFLEEVSRERSRISRLIDLTESSWEPNERGILLLQRNGGKRYCYERLSREGRRKVKRYLGTPESKAAREFVRQKFLGEKHRRLVADRALLDQMMGQYQDYGFDAVMEALPDSYREVAFESVIDARYEEIKRWAAENYPVNPTPFPDQEIYAQNGRRLRSKGECIHANIYDSMGIPFRYDCEMVFTNDYEDTRVFYPDFVILCFDGTWIIIEHLGRLFDKRYAMNFSEKCYWYLQEGFVLGRNFFVTSDDIYGGTDSRAIVEVAKAVERRFYGF